jgi:hypothetical protein
MFFVINKIDLLQGAEREEALAFIADRLRAEMQSESLRTFPLSSRLGMTARFSSDSAAYASSGLRDFEEALAVFLSLERTDAFLGSVSARAMRLVGQLSSQISAGPLSLRCGQIRDRLQGLHETAFPETAPKPPVVVQAASSRVTEVEHLPSEARVDWAQALRTRGCPVCAQIGDAAFKFYARWQQALSADESAQDQFSDEMGFCPLHTWQFLAVSSPQGLSAGYAKLAERCSQKLSEFSAAPDAAVRNIKTNSPDRQRCPACREFRAMEGASIHALAQFLKDPRGLRAYLDSQGVCLPHLALLISAARSGELSRRLLQLASRRFAEMAEDMQNYAMKHDGIRRWLQNEDERDAYLRAIVHLVGARAVCAPWQEDVEI